MVPGCCENGRPVTVDPLSGRSMCSCKLQHGRLPLPAGYEDKTNQYLPHKPEASPFYPHLVNGGFDPSKDMAMDAWRGIPQPHPGFYLPYDPAAMAAYPYAPGFNHVGYDAARRKNATKEATNTLKAWLYEHRKNPYPTKGEKIMLAIITKMTMTQISTWFANARRRLKKENKVTWSPKSRSDDEDSDDEGDGRSVEQEHRDSGFPQDTSPNTSHLSLNLDVSHVSSSSSTTARSILSPHHDNISPAPSPSQSPSPKPHDVSHEKLSPKTTKPKIWSISEVLSDKRTVDNTSPSSITSSSSTTSSNITSSSIITSPSQNFTSPLNITSPNMLSLPHTAHNSSLLYTAHASQILQGQGFAILSGNGGATQTWNPLSLTSESYANHALTLKYPHSLIAHARTPAFPGYQPRGITPVVGDKLGSSIRF